MKTTILLLLTVLVCIHSTDAQVASPKEKAKRKIEDRANSKTDDSIDKGLDKVEEGIGNIFKKKSKKDKSQKKADNQPNENNQIVADTLIKSAGGAVKSSSRFDFEPGNKVLYFDDFQRLNIGDFPAEFNTNASGEVVTVSGKSGKWLSMTKNGAFIPESIKVLPDNFTLEFEAGILGDPTNNYSGLGLNFTTDKEQLLKDMFFGTGSSILYLHPGAGTTAIQILPAGGGPEINNEIPMPQWSAGKKTFTKISIWRQNGRLRVYVDEDKLVDAPRFFSENKPYHLALFRSFFNDCQILVTNIRFAIAGEDTRSKLITEGKLVTNGILFDVNSDNIKSESGTVLREIATVLQENPAVKIKIVGHTDSDGDANANLVLSQKRALAVKNALINFYGINTSRIETDGKGESLPIQPNTTAEGKAQNRRVEFIKL